MDLKSHNFLEFYTTKNKKCFINTAMPNVHLMMAFFVLKLFRSNAC